MASSTRNFKLDWVVEPEPCTYMADGEADTKLMLLATGAATLKVPVLVVPEAVAVIVTRPLHDVPSALTEE